MSQSLYWSDRGFALQDMLDQEGTRFAQVFRFHYRQFTETEKTCTHHPPAAGMPTAHNIDNTSWQKNTKKNTMKLNELSFLKTYFH